MEDAYLKGTGKLKDFPAEMFDTFLHKDKQEKYDYEFITEDLWKWLKDKYECDNVVKRQYVKQNTKYMYSTMTQVEARFKIVPIMIIKGEDLLQGKVSKVSYSFIQMSANHTYSHLKKRLVDVIEAQGISDVKQE